jgi:hypothetical protein
VDDWIQEHLVAPARQLIRDTPLGGEVSDLGRLNGIDGLCVGIEGTFLDLARHEYSGWPAESTTDGLIAELCIRSGSCQLDFMGMCFIDFSGEQFPLRTEIDLSDDLGELARFAAYIGNVDPRTAAPPRLPEWAMIVPERDENGGHPVAFLLMKRTQLPIEWTLAFSVNSADVTGLR